MKSALLWTVGLLVAATGVTGQGRVRLRTDQVPIVQATGTSSIEGNVLDAVTREPVKQANVMLNGIVSLIATTDTSGHFAFRDLPSGKYMISVYSEKYPPPRPGFAVDQYVSISLSEDEQKHDLALTLTPGASVRGRILDEEGSPMPNCAVSLMRFQETDQGRTLQNSSSGRSDERGEYRISGVPRGKYYVMGRCMQTVMLPHALVPRGSTMDLPMLTYAPQFYPGVPDPAGAARIEASPNASITGIDLRMTPERGVSVRGRISPMPQGRNLQITLQPRAQLGELLRRSPRSNQATGEFQFQNVSPGSYELMVVGAVDGSTVFAQVPVAVGEAALEPMEVTLSPAPAISGAISIEGEGKFKLEMTNFRVSMQPLEYRQGMIHPPQAEVKSDGTFTVPSVMPGRWRLYVQGIPGYVKSVTRGDQEISAFDFVVGASTGGPLKIVVGTELAQVDATISGLPSGTEQAHALVWAANGDPSFRQSFGVSLQGKGSFNVPPGKYYACAVADAQPWMLLQNGMLRKSLESACEAVDIPETGGTNLQLVWITAQDLKRMLDKLDE